MSLEMKNAFTFEYDNENVEATVNYVLVLNE